MTALALVMVVLSSLLTTLWHHHVHRSRELRSHKEMCRHQWGETWEVGQPPNWGPAMGRGRFFVQDCPACRAQRHVNEDGSPYVPLSQRKD